MDVLDSLNFTDRCKNHTALLVYKTLNHMAPSYMSDIITVSTNNSYSLRSVLRNDHVVKHTPKTKYIKFLHDRSDCNYENLNLSEIKHNMQSRKLRKIILLRHVENKSLILNMYGQL